MRRFPFSPMVTDRRLGFLLLAGVLLLVSAAPGAQAQLPPQGDKLTIFFTSDVQGEVKSCGCPKLDLGGSSRRAAFLDTLRDSGWEFLTLDAGGIAPFGPLDAKKKLMVEHLARAMGRMGIDAVGLGDADLARGPEFVGQLMAWLGQPVVATNYAFPEGDFPHVTESRFTVRDKTVGVVGLIDPTLAGDEHEWLQVQSWEESRPAVAALSEEVDYLVALAGVADSTRFRALADAIPEIDLIVGSHRGELPTVLEVIGSTRAVGGGTQGKYLGRVEVAFSDAGAVESVDAIFHNVIKQWGHRAYVDEIILEYNRRVRDLLMSGDAAGD